MRNTPPSRQVSDSALRKSANSQEPGESQLGLFWPFSIICINTQPAKMKTKRNLALAFLLLVMIAIVQGCAEEDVLQVIPMIITPTILSY